MICVRRKQGLPITQAHKFGKERSTAENVIFGLLAVSYMKCVPYTLLLGLKIFQVFIVKLLLEIMTQFLLITLKSFEI
jgi:hypothetical protein